MISIIGALHDVKTGHNLITKNRVQNLDQIGRRAVAKLIKEGKKDLDKRLMINEWGSIIRGQEHTYFDFFHPLRNPSSWVYGQVLLNQLKMIAEDS